MKKFYLKLFILNLLVFGGFIFTSCSDNDENEIENVVEFKDLPSKAQIFLNDYFPGVEIKTAERQQIQTVIMYDVILENGYEIMFNSEGEWQEVDAPDGKSIPSGIAPEAIEEYINKNYSDYGINEINKTGDGYNVELTTGLEMSFNELGEFTGIISDF